MTKTKKEMITQLIEQLNNEFGLHIQAFYDEPPELIGVKLKDGTLVTDINDGGSGGYENGNMNEFVSRTNFSKILEIDEIDSLLFIKDYPENGHIKITEKNCYVVKLK